MSKDVNNNLCETMTLEELAARLGIGLTKAYELARHDKLPVPRLPIPGPYRFSRRAYDAVMERLHDRTDRDNA